MRERQPENSYPMNTVLRSGREAPAEAAIIMPSSLGTVLLVEDEEGIREVTAMLLSHLKYSVICAACGADAIEKFQKHQGSIDVLLTDVVMPGINGRVLAERLAPLQPGMKVLYMSGYTDSFIAGHGVLEQGTHLLHKPFTQEGLSRKVRELLEDRKSVV